jgi:putative transposase
MDGRGRTFDNIFIERFWRNLKHEDIYLKCYENVPALIDGVADYIEFYNEERPHQSLDYLTPLAVYKEAGKGVNRAPGHSITHKSYSFVKLKDIRRKIE